MAISFLSHLFAFFNWRPHVAAATIWHSFPLAVRMCTNHDHLSSKPFNPLSTFSFMPKIRLRLAIVPIGKLYLLTYLRTYKCYTP